MALLKWFLWRRWKFKRFYNAFPEIDRADALNNFYRVNLHGCQQHRAIWLDIFHILTAEID
jgi:hypothetical protein